MQADDVKKILQSHLPECEFTVSGDGNHFDITAIGDVFDGLNAVKRQQLLYGGLSQQIADGSVHAVNMKTFTRTEWQQAKDGA
ncbi:MAG: BolA/IbaG family iron-sulfur metabolism protein [Spongiibacteraceae bacterium]|nr:BolA/IbaG family iron-sulfur metabolism protein [Spongiibacteraceae bacterium]